MDLQQILEKQFQRINKEGFVENTIKTQLEETIKNMVENVFGTYTDFSKGLEKYVNEQLKLNFERLDLPHFHQIVRNTIQENLNENVLQPIRDNINSTIESRIGLLPKTHWKLSEIIEKFKETIDDEEILKNEEIYFEIEDSSYGHCIYFDQNSATSHDIRAKFNLRIQKDGTLWSFQCKNEYSFETPNFNRNSYLESFQDFIFKLYVGKCTIEVDEVDVSLPCSEEW